MWQISDMRQILGFLLYTVRFLSHRSGIGSALDNTVASHLLRSVVRTPDQTPCEKAG